MILKTRNTIAALLVLCALSAVALNGVCRAQSVLPLQPSKKSEATKWEYCAITSHDYTWDNNKKVVGRVIICYFQDSGCRENLIRTEPVSYESEDVDVLIRAEKKAFVKAIAQLGDDGWELVGALPFTRLTPGQEKEPTVLYFKRAKR